jgi:mRNA interferase RelE/StbE
MMKKWELKLTKTAKHDFDNLERSIKKSVKNKLKWLQENFERISYLPLRGELKGLFKLRVGDYRIIYEIDWENGVIYILAIDHRKNIYKKL